MILVLGLPMPTGLMDFGEYQMRLRAIVVACVVALTCCSQDKQKVAWARLKNPDEVRSAITRLLPPDASREDLLRFLRGHDVPDAEIGNTKDLVRCKVDGPRASSLVGSVWLIQFHLGNDRVKNIEINQGFIGP
jgi:hypothetical protein